MLNSNLKSLIRNLWDKFWSGGIANPITAIEQITYLLFMKRIDELDKTRERDAEFLQTAFSSMFAGDSEFVIGRDDEGKERYKPKSELRWSFFKTLPADVLFQDMQLYIFPFIKKLNGNNSFFTKHIANAVFVIPKAGLLVEAIKTIDSIYDELAKGLSGKQTFQDTQGDIYEYLLNEIASAGKNGQFRTPRHIIALLCELLNPQLGHKIADPACGTAGFLLAAYQYILTQHTSSNWQTRDENGFMRGTLGDKLVAETDRQTIQQRSFYGFDMDTTMVRIGLMNLMMHGIDKPNIDYADALSKNFNQENEYDVVLANPPFTGNIDKEDINTNLKLPTTKTELLFVERIYSMLRRGGTAGVIIPQGVLFGSGKAFVAARAMLVEQCELKAVIALPSGVFKPYAGVATAMLIFTKAGTTDRVWFYNILSDGYTLDDKRQKLDNYGDLQDVLLRYKERLTHDHSNRKEKYFWVPKADIVANDYDLSFNKYKVEEHTAVEYPSPKELMERLEILENSIQTKLSDLKKMLEL